MLYCPIGSTRLVGMAILAMLGCHWLCQCHAAGIGKGDSPFCADAKIGAVPGGEIESSREILRSLGMDLGLLDTLRDRTRIGHEERECFYQMLAAVGRARPGQLAEAARQRLADAGSRFDSVVPLFNDPDAQRGRLVLLTGTARRITRVRVDEPDVVERFGIDHYFELYLFTDDSQQNPLVFCVRAIPEGMPTGEGPRYAERIEVAGFFLKSWAYRSVAQRENPGAARQLAPLLVGGDVRRRPAPEPGGWGAVGAVTGGLFLLVLAAVAILLRRASLADRRFRREILGRFREPDGGVREPRINTDKVKGREPRMNANERE
ncbi:MAG: hypothetical protein JW809_13265 [Pirellulales bacterium]|nr:hypothetical protein [Pirellulales bacterium]